MKVLGDDLVYEAEVLGPDVGTESQCLGLGFWFGNPRFAVFLRLEISRPKTCRKRTR